jgi:hypothetical protein
MFGIDPTGHGKYLTTEELFTTVVRMANYFPIAISYMTTSADRARLLLRKLGPKKTSEYGGEYERWRSVSKGIVRVSTEEIDVLVKIYPQYALWLASGQIAPESGQTSPDYDEANRNLSQPNAG